MKLMIQCVAGLVSLALVAAPAAAGSVTIAQGSGKAFVDNGSGFVIAKHGAAVSAGDRVMAMSGEVVLSDASGCTVTVQPGDMLAVNGSALCATAVVAAQGQSKGVLEKRNGQWVWIVGGIVIAVGIAALALSNDSDKTSP